MKMHHSLYVWLILLTWIVLIVTFFFAGAATTAQLGIYQNTEIELTAEFYLDATPAGWAFSIWGFIYAYQVIWLIYATVNIFRKSPDGTPLYACAPFIHWSVFVVYIINLISSIVWTFVFDRKLLSVALIPISLLPLTMYITTALSIYGIYRYYPLLAQNGFGKENRYVLGLVSNAFAMYGTWTTVATLINLSMVLAYRSGVPQEAASTILLAILTAELMIWVLLDLAFLERFTRFLFTPYIVLIIALSGIVAKNFNGYDPNDIFSVMLLVAVIAVFCIKICLVVHREMKMPAFKKVAAPKTKTIIYT